MVEEKIEMVKKKRLSKKTIEARKAQYTQTPKEEKIKLLIGLRENKYGGHKIDGRGFQIFNNLWALKPFGHKWKCKQCGNCCIWCEAEIFKSEIDQIKRFTNRDDFWIKDKKSTTGYRLKHTDGKCVFLNEKRRCMIYNLRPTICQLFPIVARSSMLKNESILLFQYGYDETDDHKMICNGFEEGEMDFNEWKRDIEKALKVYEKYLLLRKISSNSDFNQIESFMKN